MTLHLPPRVQREIQKDKWADQRAQHRATLRRLLDFEDSLCVEWTRVVAKIDPYLCLGRAHPQAYEEGFNVRPGFYHWVRWNETATPTVEPITGPDGESFAEPDASLLEHLRRNDLQDPRVFAAVVARHGEREKAEERRLEEHQAKMDREVLERWNAGTRTQVLLSDDVAWSQNAAGRRGVRQ
jgi:hypothetical protein